MSSSEGHSLYKQGQYAAAAAIYSQLLQQSQDAATRSTILSNRAACALQLNDPAAAEADCKAGLALNPVSAKLRLKLAKALAQQDHPAAAAAEVAAAVALMLPDRPSDEVLQLYQQLSAAGAASEDRLNSALLQLPADPCSIRYLSTAQQLMAANARQAAFIVLAPGTYSLPGPLDGAISSSGCTILGLGRVVLTCSVCHAAWVRKGKLTLVNVQLVGSCAGAAVCVSPQTSGGFGLLGLMQRSGAGAGTARCTMIDCRVEGYPEVGLLVCGDGADAILQRCSFRRCKLQAVEIRESGSLCASHTVVDSCRQGFSAYGGAKNVELYSCSIQNTSKEGVLAAGSFENAATAAQQKVHGPRSSSTLSSELARSASEAAEAWGKQRGQQLTLVMRDCSLQGCGNFGVSIDAGAAARISRCQLEGCDPYCVFIKGNSDACITACQFVFGGKSAKSTWAQSYGGHALAAAGVQIGVNYAGVVQLFGNAFAGPQGQAIFSEGHELLKLDRRASTTTKASGMWTRPPTEAGNTFHTRADQLPSLDALAAKLPGAPRHDPTGRRSSSSSSSRLQVSAAECRRPSSTFPGSSWSPTSCQYYAIGNTAGFNVAEGAPPQQQRVRALLAGCGDIHNLLASVAGLEDSVPAPAKDSTAGGGSRQQQRWLQFVLNDGNISMLARNAVMLHMIIEQHVPPEVVLAVWANHALSEQEHQLLMDSCKALATGPWPDWLSAANSIDTAAAGSAAAVGVRSSDNGAAAQAAAGSASGATSSCSSGRTDSNSSSVGAAEAAVRAACAAWAACTVSLQHLLQERDALAGTPALRQAAMDFSLSAVAAATTGSNGGSGGSNGSSSGGSNAGRSLSKPLVKEITEYIRTGSLAVHGRSDKQPRNQPNITLLKAPELQYGLYFSSSMFRAVQLQSRLTNAFAGSGAVAMLLGTVGPQIEAVAATARQGRLQVALLPGDILTVGTAATAAGTANTAAAAVSAQGPPEHDVACSGMFDYIDTSNVSIYTSLPALLHTCAALLDPAPHARLRLESLVAFERAKQHKPNITHRAFVEAALGLNLTTHELLLGLRLLASTALPGTQGGVRMEWGPVRSNITSSSSNSTGSSVWNGVPGVTAGESSMSIGPDQRSSQQASTAAAAAGGSAAPPLSAVSLFLDLKPAYKRFVEAYTGPIAAASSLGGSSAHTGSSSSSSGGRVDWPSVGSPASLAHMLAVTAPSAARPLIKALLRSAAAVPSSKGVAVAEAAAAAAATAGLFKWELTMHAAISAGSMNSCSQITVPTRPEFRLVGHSTQPHPLLLALSPKPLGLGTVQATQVKQLFSNFAWDEELAVATLLLPAAVTETGPAWARYVTLCVVSEEGLEAVSESAVVAELAHRSVPVQPWRGVTPQQGAGTGLDCSLLEAAGAWGSSVSAAADDGAGGVEQHWRSVLVAGTGCVVVDVLAPGPIAGAAVVKVAATPSQLTVTVSEGGSAGKSSGGKGSSGSGQEEAAAAMGKIVRAGEVVVMLPVGLFAEGCKVRSSTKLSRAMGLLSVKVTAE